MKSRRCLPQSPNSKGKNRVFDVTGAGGYLSANDPRLLDGLGESPSVKAVETRRSSGKTERFENLKIDRFHRIKEK